MFKIPTTLEFLIVVMIIAAILDWLSATGRLGTIIAKFRSGRTSDSQVDSDIIQPSDLIPMYFEYNNSSYGVIGMEKIKSYDEEIGNSIYRITYNNNGIVKNVDVSENRLEIPITPETLRAESLTIRYRSDIATSKAENTNQILRNKLNQLKIEVLALKDKMNEQQMPQEYRAARDKQREGAVHSSRTFNGFGTRYTPDDGGMGDD